MKKIEVTLSGDTNINNSTLLKELKKIGNNQFGQFDLSPNCRPGKYILTVFDSTKTEIVKDLLLVAVNNLSQGGTEVSFKADSSI